ncbi:NACHT domain-containing protein [Amycolatopsis sp. GA6-003]|uniref:NACHT domain-containing protein n=1 Tax=Amycolatopsis sp. GA6-003 TaxID=2652444 RepID=UPI0039175835
MRPSEGEVRAVVGFGAQYELAARVVLTKLPTLEWIRLGDPEAGVADDLQFGAGGTHYALQVKWSQYPGTYTWAQLASGTKDEPALLRDLADAWQKLRNVTAGPLVVCLCTNNTPSTSPAKSTTSIGQSSAPAPRSLATFLARSFDPVRHLITANGTRWDELATRPEVTQWEPVWTALRTCCGLADDEFVAFLRDLDLKFGLHPVDPLLRAGHDSAGRDAQHLAHTLMEIVRDPARPTELSRDQLLERLGWQNRQRYRHPHRFPVPKAYVANDAALTQLQQRLNVLPGGYTALVGPAGSGKSTLLASLALRGRVVRYYAFVPDSPDPLSSRGEAESFLHDICLALEETGLYRPGVGNNLSSQHAVLQDQLDQARKQWIEQHRPTFIIIDGLDHIAREQNPTRSLLDELPAPAALPDGVFVVLGTQTTTILPPPIQATLETDNRVVPLPPLSDHEVTQIGDAAGLSDWLTPGQANKLVTASEGHPLALTYLIQDLTALADKSADARRDLADTILTAATSTGGDIRARYEGYLRAVADDSDVLELLAVVARLRVPVNLDWLATWAQPSALTAFTERAATFFRRTGPEWHFVHNSFRVFLTEKTATIAGRVDRSRDRALHDRLAGLCASADDDWPLYRDEELAHRLLAGDIEQVLVLATPQRLRGALTDDLRPLSTVTDHALLALRAAVEADDSAALLRILLFRNELLARGLALDPESLADAIAHVEPGLEDDHIVAGGRLRLKTDAALAHAARYAEAGRIDAAERIVRACGGLAALAASSKVDADAAADWAETTWYLSGLDAVLTQLDRQLPRPSTESFPPDAARKSLWDVDREEQDEYQRAISTIDCRHLVHARCFDLAVEVRDNEVLDRLTEVIDNEASAAWRARARFVRARVAAADGERRAAVHSLHELAAIDASATAESDDEDSSAHAQRHAIPLQLRVAAAELLIREDPDATTQIEGLVPAGTTTAWPDTVGSEAGLDPYRSIGGLLRLRSLRPDPVLAAADLVTGRRNVADNRLLSALQALGELEAGRLKAAMGQGSPPIIATYADTVIRVLEVPREQTSDWAGWYAIARAAVGCFERLVRVAAGGQDHDLPRVLEQFDRAWRTPERARFWPATRRQAVVVAALETGSDVRIWATDWLSRLDADIDTTQSDPHDRTLMWLTQARAWTLAEQPAMGRQAIQRAVRASAHFVSSDGDNQLADWIDWLEVAIDSSSITADDVPAAISSYASRLESAASIGEHIAGAAAERLIKLAFPHDVALACRLADQLCDAEALSEDDAIEAIVLGACRDDRIPASIAASAAARVLYPVKRWPTQAIADAIRGRTGPDSEPSIMLADAARVWSVTDNQLEDAEPEEAASNVRHVDDHEVVALPENPGALLAQLRRAADQPPRSREYWNDAVARAATGTVPPSIARALLEHAELRQLNGLALGGIVALAARSGEADRAVGVLTNALAHLPGYGWLRYTDRGTRLTLFDAALRDRHPALVSLARHDLLNSIVTGALPDQLEPRSLRRIIELVAGKDIVAAAWTEVDRHLDVLIPDGDDDLAIATSRTTDESPLQGLTRWLCGYLGHPIRPLDFGARHVLQCIEQHEPAITDLILTEAVRRGGWDAEAALLTMITAPGIDEPRPLSPQLFAAIRAAGTGPDAIIRDLTRRLARQHGEDIPHAPARPLPGSYQLVFQPLPERVPPEMNSDGVPHLDLNDPQQIVAPFDTASKLIARMASLDTVAVMHRVATIARSNDERWTRGGHHEHFSRLAQRGLRLSYRPWAYMVGRRAFGHVLAELLDAGLLNGKYPAYQLCAITEKSMEIEVSALDAWIPLPWRPEGTRTFSVATWCQETADAAIAYIDMYSTASPYVLAERSQWCSLEWGTPEEERRLYTQNGSGPSEEHEGNAWHREWRCMDRYPDGLPQDWDGRTLVLDGDEQWSDAPILNWLALHPQAGRQLGWTPDERSMFGWKGPDGEWRARTVLQARGQLSFQPPAAAACAELWQVVVSPRGYTELSAMFRSLKRTLEITRIQPPNRREGREGNEQSATVLLREPS